MRRHVIAVALAIGVLVCARIAHADEIRVLSSVGIKAVVEDLAPKFEKTTKHRVVTMFGLSANIKKDIDSGAPFDIAILTPAMIDDLAAKGIVTPASKSVIARAGLGLMIRAGAKKPDVSTVDAFKKTLLGAKAITFVPAGASGVAFLAIVKQLGIADMIKTKTAASGDEVNANVTGGAADLAILPISEILPVKGAELGGVFPAEVQTYVVMAAGTSAKSRTTAAADFIGFLLSRSNDDVIRKKGMERPK